MESQGGNYRLILAILSGQYWSFLFEMHYRTAELERQLYRKMYLSASPTTIQ